jgi:hypothetical protein
MEPLFDKLARQASRHKNAKRFVVGMVKFVISMIVMTMICEQTWDAFLVSKVYSCGDEAAGYLFFGVWVTAHVSHPAVVVHQVAPSHQEGDSDTIKEGWSVMGLCCVWISFFLLSLIVSIVFACVSWITTLDRLADKIHGYTNAA